MSHTPIRLLLVDDHVSYSRAIAFMLDHEPDLQVVAQAGTLAAARAVLRERGAQIDIALVDLDLPDGSGVTLAHELHERNPAAHTVVLTGSRSARDRVQAIEAGAAEMLHKSIDVPEIVAACRRLCAGEVLIPPKELVELLRIAGRQRQEGAAVRQTLERLTDREREVLRALADGLSDREIAVRMGISPETVRTHMVNLLGKLGVDSRLQALVLGLRYGVVQIG